MDSPNASKPTVIFVPGFWEGPGAFATVSTILNSHDFETDAVTLRSTGKRDPPPGSGEKVITMLDDAAAVRSVVSATVEHGKQVVMVLHSAGGFLGAMAVEGLLGSDRAAHGEKGGVIGLVGLSPAWFPEGHVHGKVPSASYEDGVCLCTDPRGLLFNDVVSDEEAERLIRNLQSQPATGWDGTITYAAWKHLPSVFLVCTEDRVIPAEWQRMFAQGAGSRVVECDAGHMVPLTQPETVARVIETAIAEWV